MNILILTPTCFPTLTGNAVDVHRLSQKLQDKNHNILVLTPEKIDSRLINDFKPDLVHAFHAYKSRQALDIARHNKLPLVVTMTGTDYNKDLQDREKKKHIQAVLEYASKIVFYNAGSQLILHQNFPEMEVKSTVIYRGELIFSSQKFDFRKAYEIDRKALVFAMIGGIRPVKNNIFPLSVFQKLYQTYPHLKLVFVGEIRDKVYGNLFMEQLKVLPFVKFLGPIEREKMCSVYEGIDVVLNTSHSEGDNNVIFEALQNSKPILVNSTVAPLSLDNKIPEVVYKAGDPDSLYKKVEAYITANSFRKEVAKKGHDYYQSRLNSHESEDYEQVYKYVLSHFSNHSHQ